MSWWHICIWILLLWILGCRYLFELGFFFFPRYIPRSGIAGLWSNSSLGFLRSPHTVLHGGCTNLQSLQHCPGVPFSLHRLQHLVFVDFLWQPFWQVSGDSSLFCNKSWCWAFFFRVVLSPLYTFSEKISIQVFCSFFKLGCLVFWYWVYIFWILALYWSYHLETFSPIQ